MVDINIGLNLSATFILSSMYWSTFSGSFISNLLSFIGLSSLRSKSVFALLISDRRNSASFREALKDKHNQENCAVTVHFCLVIICSGCNLVAVLDCLVSLSETLVVLLCLSYFSLCHIKLLFPCQVLDLVRYVGTGPPPPSMALIENTQAYQGFTAHKCFLKNRIKIILVLISRLICIETRPTS